jgi:2-polyprenyl-6-methoxyphenol hydroxylase-like FAD-dependent oxidoreductase
MSTTLKVAVIGAGPAGCTLARLLHLAKINVTVFEGEDSANYRTQGGTLDLHAHTGLLALKDAGLFDEFLKYARYDGQYMAIVDKDLQYYIKRGATNKVAQKLDDERPEIDRAMLRKILVESLPEGMIKWGHHLKRVEDDHTLVFEHATISGFDLIVGAEGAWSKVRGVLASEVKPSYVGIGFHELSIPDAATTAPELYELVNRGSVFAYSDGKKMSIQQMGDGSINVYVGVVRKDEDWMAPEKCGYDAHNLDETQRALMADFQDWNPKLKDSISRTSGKCTPRSLYMLPVGFKWTHHPGVTIIGDAAHLMAPYAGEGVNVALEDALKLSRAITAAAKEGGSSAALSKHVEAFEKEMFPRMERVQSLTEGLTQDWMFTPGAPKTVLATAMSRHIKYRMPAFLNPLAPVMAYSLVFVQKIMN